MGDRRPKKPIRNPSHIVFPKKGPVRSVVEELPREQEELEFTVGRKFLAALQHFEGVQFHDLCRGSEPADLVCKSSDGHTVSLQIVEVIDQQLRQLQQMRSSYRGALVEILGEERLHFNGCRVSLVDSGDPPYLPQVSSQNGQGCLGVLAEHIRPSIDTLLEDNDPDVTESRRILESSQHPFDDSTTQSLSF